MNNIERAEQKIKLVIAGSRVPEDPYHADNTLKWLLRLKPDSNKALQLAALAHDIERASEKIKIKRGNFGSYDAFKAAHAKNSVKILRPILVACDVKRDIIENACWLVKFHEVGGEVNSDLLKDADSISYFDVNLPFYFQREGPNETKQRSCWGYQRLSLRGQKIVQHICYKNKELTCLLQSVFCNNDSNCSKT